MRYVKTGVKIKMIVEHDSNAIERTTEVLGEKPLRISLSTIKPTRTVLGSNQGLCSERPATNFPRYSSKL
jgi:hypothetical protein